MATKKRTRKPEAPKELKTSLFKVSENYKGKTLEIRVAGQKYVCPCIEQRGNQILLQINNGVTRWFNIKALKASYLRVIK